MDIFLTRHTISSLSKFWSSVIGILVYDEFQVPVSQWLKRMKKKEKSAASKGHVSSFHVDSLLRVVKRVDAFKARKWAELCKPGSSALCANLIFFFPVGSRGLYLRPKRTFDICNAVITSIYELQRYFSLDEKIIRAFMLASMMTQTLENRKRDFSSLKSLKWFFFKFPVSFIKKKKFDTE